MIDLDHWERLTRAHLASQLHADVIRHKSAVRGMFSLLRARMLPASMAWQFGGGCVIDHDPNYSPPVRDWTLNRPTHAGKRHTSSGYESLECSPTGRSYRLPLPSSYVDRLYKAGKLPEPCVSPIEREYLQRVIDGDVSPWCGRFFDPQASVKLVNE